MCLCGVAKISHSSTTGTSPTLQDALDQTVLSCPFSEWLQEISLTSLNFVFSCKTGCNHRLYSLDSGECGDRRHMFRGKKGQDENCAIRKVLGNISLCLWRLDVHWGTMPGKQVQSEQDTDQQSYLGKGVDATWHKGSNAWDTWIPLWRICLESWPPQPAI